MPYAKLSDLPDAAKKLPKQAQRVFRAAFNSAHKKYRDESKAFAVAWAAAKRGAKKQGERRVAKAQEAGAMNRLLTDLETFYAEAARECAGIPAEQLAAVQDLLAQVAANPEQDAPRLKELEQLWVPTFQQLEQHYGVGDYGDHLNDFPGSLGHHCRLVCKALHEESEDYLGCNGFVLAVYPAFTVVCAMDDLCERDPEYYKVDYELNPETLEVTLGESQEVDVLTVVVSKLEAPDEAPEHEGILAEERVGGVGSEDVSLPVVEQASPMKTDNGQKFGRGAYLIIGDPDKPSTWKVRVEESPGKITVAQLGRAYAALTKGFRGNKVSAPAEKVSAALSRLRGLYRKMDAPFPGAKEKAQAAETLGELHREAGRELAQEVAAATMQAILFPSHPAWLLQGEDPPGGEEDLSQTIEFDIEQAATSKAGVMRITGVATVGNIVNAKGEVYPTQVWEDTMPRLQQLLQEGKLLGESDHPVDHRPSLDRTCVAYRAIWLDGDQIKFQADILPTDPCGKNLQTLIQNGVKVDISSRGKGTRVKSDWVHPTTGERYQGVYVIQRGFRGDAFDPVASGASPGSAITDYTVAQQADQGAAEEEIDMERLEALTQQVEKLAAGQVLMQDVLTKLATADGSEQGKPPEGGTPQDQSVIGLLGRGSSVDIEQVKRLNELFVRDRKNSLLEEARVIHKLPPVWFQMYQRCLDESNVSTVEELEQVSKNSLTLIKTAYDAAPKFPGGGFQVQQDAGERPGPKTGREMIEHLIKDLPDDDGDTASWVRQDTEDGTTYRAPDHVRTPRRQVRQLLTNIAEARIDGWNGPAALTAYTQLFQGYNPSQVQANWLDQACSDCTTAVGASGAPSSAIFIFPLVRRVFPQLIAPEIASVQPMDRPDGRIFFLDAYRISTGVDSVDEGGNTVADKMRIDRSESFSSSYSDRAAECDTANCLTLRLSSKTVTAETKALHAVWTIEELQDLRAYHNLDVSSELVASLSREVALEWNQRVLQEMLDGATAGSRNFGTVAPSGYTQKEWDEYLVRYLDAASNDIFKKRHGDMTHVIAGPSAWLQLSASFRAGVKPSGPNPEMYAGLTLTPFMAGSSVNVKTYKTSFWSGVNTNKILVLRRGADWSDTPYVWAPYIDYVSPTLTLPDNFTQKQGIMSRAAHKVVVGSAMATITINSGVTGVTVT